VEESIFQSNNSDYLPIAYETGSKVEDLWEMKGKKASSVLTVENEETDMVGLHVLPCIWRGDMVLFKPIDVPGILNGQVSVMRCQELSTHCQNSYACQTLMLNYSCSSYSLNMQSITLKKSYLVLPWKQQWVCLLWLFCKKDKLLRKRGPVQIHGLRSSSEKQMFHSGTVSVVLSKVNYLVWLYEFCALGLRIFSPI